nr:nuclear pore complex protein NUP96-like isoform X1 [Tanacetum cinerariifolium]
MAVVTDSSPTARHDGRSGWKSHRCYSRLGSDGGVVVTRVYSGVEGDGGVWMIGIRGVFLGFAENARRKSFSAAAGGGGGWPAAAGNDGRDGEAVYHAYYGNSFKALEHCLGCEFWQKAHSTFITSVAHSLFMSGKQSEIWRLATSMEDHKSEIENWDLGAGIYIKYYTLRRSLKEDESSMNEPVCNSVTYNDRMVAIS